MEAPKNHNVAVPKLLNLAMAETFGFPMPPVLVYDDKTEPPRVMKVDPRYFLQPRG